LKISILDYRRSGLNPSDHKPVSALFNCSIHKIIDTKLKKVFQEYVEILDSNNKSSSQPEVEIKGLNIEYDKVLKE
jgi:hypothetical protein